MVAEIRAGRLDLAARTKFAADGEQVYETRLLLFPPEEEFVVPEERDLRSGSRLRQAAENGFVEVG